MKSLFKFVCIAVFLAIANGAIAGNSVIFMSTASSSAAAGNSSDLGGWHIYNVVPTRDYCCDDADEGLWTARLPIAHDEQEVSPQASQVCPTFYQSDIVFEARSSRLEGVGADTLVKFLGLLNQRAIEGCSLPQELEVVGFACRGCDKTKGQKDEVVEWLATVRSEKLKKAVEYYIDTRGFSALKGMTITTQQRVVDVPELGVMGKTASISGSVQSGNVQDAQLENLEGGTVITAEGDLTE